MKTPKPVVIDFETLGIMDRPLYPPVPVGVSIKWPGKKSKYFAWGHVTGNNCGWGAARAELAKAYATKCIAFQNGKFDVDVAEVHMDLPVPTWENIHDTMFLLFLDDPHQTELGLKPSAVRLLGHAPDERDEIRDWLLQRQPIPGVKISKSKQSDHYFGRYIAFAPGELVEKYACSDTDSTDGIFQLLWPKTQERGMLPAYDRERHLMPILLEMERQGVPVDIKKLRTDVGAYGLWREQVEVWILKTIKAPPGLNLDSGAELIEAMIAAKKVDLDLMPLTATGKYQTNKDALLLGVKDKVLLAMLKYRAQLKTSLGTFMAPWLEMAEATGGLIHTNWNQIKSPAGGGNVGARTGRLSATWFMNMPKEFDAIWSHEETDQKKAKLLPKCPLVGLPHLPRTRSYITPWKGEVLIDRDYSQQEPRILAHFDGGSLMDTYVANPWVDFHDYAKAELAIMGLIFDRKPVKTTNLGLIYGMGIGTLAEKTGLSVDETKVLKEAILSLYPGLKAMYKDMKLCAKNNIPIHTWGGREYYCEPPKIIDGRMRTFDYKLVNILIQGSAADCTKEAIIRFWEAKKAAGKPGWRIILNVHDQITVSVPRADVHEAMEMLRECMESIEFDVPMLSEGSVSSTNWAELKDFDKKGVLQVCKY